MNLALLSALRMHDYPGDVALRAHDAPDAAVLEAAGVDLVLARLRDGAKEAVDLLTAWRVKSTAERG